MEDAFQSNIAYDCLKQRAENLFLKEPDVKFWPYIGSKYFEAKFKILVIGESHYNCKRENDENKELTIDEFANSYLNMGSKNQLGYYYQFESFAQYPLGETTHKQEWLGKRRTAELILGAANLSYNSDYAWDYLAFYNFYQKLVGCCSNCDKWYCKNKEQYHNEAKAALPKVIKELKPDLIIIWENDRFREANLDYKIENGKEHLEGVEVFRINHPARELIREEFTSKWKQDGFLEKISINSYENDLNLLEKIEKEVNDRLKCGTVRKRGRQYLSFELFASKKDGKLVGSTKNLVCDIICKENFLTTRFYTRKYKASDSKRILNQICVKYEKCDDLGRCILKSETYNSNYIEFLSHFVEKMIDYRDLDV